MDTSNSYFASSVGMPMAPAPLVTNGHTNQPTVDTAMNGISVPLTPGGSIPPTPGSLAGRKRSRADIHDLEEDDDEQLEDGSVTTTMDGQSIRPRGKPVYGPAMTLIYAEDPGYEAAAESQSGYGPEANGTRPNFQLSHAKRPSISSRKSQRKDTTAGSDNLAQLVLPPQIREATMEPLIDEATRVLGISWTRMDASEALQINQAAYSKWIQNHYPGLKDVAVWFENSAIPGYLVEARNAYSGQQEYYIFSHDLTEARLVTTEPAQLVPRLKLLPALHLAAPGGHIRAEADPITVGQNEINNAVQAQLVNDCTQFSKEITELRGQTQAHVYPSPEGSAAEPSSEPNPLCSAHEMELD